MKNKQILVGLGAVAVVASFINQANADEVTDSNVKKSETIQNTKIEAPSEADVKKAENELNKANSEVKANQEVVDKAKQAQETALENEKSAENTVKKVQEVADKATPSDIKNAQANVDKKQGAVSEAEKTLNNAKKVDQKAQEAVNTQQKNVDDAIKQVAKEKEDVSNAQEKVKEAEDAFDSASLVKAQKEVKELETKKAVAEEKVNTLTNQVGEANKELTALKVSGSEKRSTLEKELKNAGPEFLTEVVTHELDRKETPDFESKTPALTSDKMVARDGKTYYIAANEDVDFNGEKTEVIEVKSKEDFEKPHVIDYKKVSEEVRNYLIELRKINGIDIPVPEVTDKALKYAKARSDEMIEKDELSHATKLKKEDFGLRGSTENASAGTLPYEDTVSEKELAYNLILRYFNDYSNASSYGSETPNEANPMNYGHRIPLLAASGTGIAVGSSFDEKSKYGNYGTLQFVTDDPSFPVYPTVEGSYTSTYNLAKAENKDSDMSHSEFYFNGKRVKFLPKTTFVYVWKEITHPKNPEFEKAKKVLDTFNAKQTKDEATVAQKLATLNTEYNAAKNTLDKDKVELKVANDRLADLKKDNEEKVKTLNLAQSELSKQEAELVNAQSNLTKQEAEMKRLKGIKVNALKLVKEAENVLTTTKNELNKAQQYVFDLQNAPKILEEAKNRLSEAKQKLAIAQKNYDEAIEKLNSAKAHQEKAQKEYTTVSEAYGKYMKAKQEKELQEKLKHEYKEIVPKVLSPVVVTDKKGSIIAYKTAVTPSLMATKRIGKVYDAKSTILPQTGDKTTPSLVIAGMLVATGLGFVKLKRKEN